MYTLEASTSFCTDKDENVDKDEDVEERERGSVGFLEGNQRYKIWRSLLISFMLGLLIVE